MNISKARWIAATMLAGGSAVALLAVCSPAAAQSANAESSAAAQSATATQPIDTLQPANTASGAPSTVSEVVVTGTLIRGQAPVGAELTTVTAAQISQLGVVDTSQLLSSVPQDSNFNNRPQVGNYGQYQSVNAPLLRYLGGGSSGSNSTLLLIDGVRLPGMGILQTSADIDAIPPEALERVDIATDGGSATYGADAVGGVVNLVTRKSFNGVEVGSHYGAADDYNQYDFDITAGKTWNKISVWGTYDYTHHDLIYNNARDYVHDLNYTTTPYTGNEFTCSPGNFIAGGYVRISTPPYYKKETQTFPIVNGVPVSGTPNTCDTSQSRTFFPGEDRHSALVGADVKLTDWLTFDLRAYYTHRDTYADNGPNVYQGVAATACTYGATICAEYPFLATTGAVSGSFVNSLGAHTYAKTSLDTEAIIPRLTAKLGHDWELVAFFNAGEGYSRFEAPYEYGDATALATDVSSGLFNPFTGLFATSAAGQAAQAHQANYYGYSSGNDVIYNSRGVFDGPLFRLPGGEVRMAFGAEYFHEDFTQRNGETEIADFDTIPYNSVSRTVNSGFGELSVPLVGADNRFTGVYGLTLSAAVRYDSYSDFGGTTDPKFGGNWRITDWWSIRGNWGKSFQAPSLASTASAIPPAVVAYPASTFGGNPAYPNTSGLTILTLYPGGGINLQPQKATTYEIGSEVKPPAVPGLVGSLTYYNIDFTNRIDTPAFYSNSFYALYPNSYIMNTAANPFTSAEITQYLSKAYNIAQVAQYINNPGTVYALENALSQNLSIVTTDGIDFNLNYEHPTGFGSVFAGVAGTYILSYNTQATPTSVIQGLGANSVSRMHMSTTFGAKYGDLLAKATWNYSEGYDVPATAGDAYQAHVGSFSTLNLAFLYTPTLPGVWSNITLSLNIDNICDTNPPPYNGDSGAGYGYAGFTLGRFIEVGVKKRF